MSTQEGVRYANDVRFELPPGLICLVARDDAARLIGVFTVEVVLTRVAEAAQLVLACYRPPAPDRPGSPTRQSFTIASNLNPQQAGERWRAAQHSLRQEGRAALPAHWKYETITAPPSPVPDAPAEVAAGLPLPDLVRDDPALASVVAAACAHALAHGLPPGAGTAAAYLTPAGDRHPAEHPARQAF
ncbi:MAG: hypothetical protein JW910_14290, partial [Anaerolineae bacterium]|nr:hypothetical protein [Anaerolineae bacterium]